MTAQIFANNTAAVVTSGGTTAPAAGTVESWTLSGAVLPAAVSGFTAFYAADPALPDEKFLVTDVSGTTATVTRGADGTTPAAHTSGFTIRQVVPAGVLGDFYRGGFVVPSGDQTGATDPVNVQNALAAYGYCRLAPGAYYADATVTGHEAQFVEAPGAAATWTMTAAGIPAFEWTPANTSGYSQTGKGGLRGGLAIFGSASVTNPTDGSVAVQMGDIVALESDFYAHNFQYGLLLENQYFYAEQGNHKVRTIQTTNPVVAQCAATGASTRTGSFDRTVIEVSHDDAVSGTYGLGGVQVLAGAQFRGGAIRQRGNFSGTGQAGVYALYIDGSSPSGAAVATVSSLIGAEITHAVEYDGTGTAPGTVYVGSGCYVNPGYGGLQYYAMGAPSITGAWVFYGPISGDSSLARTGQFTEVALTYTGFTGYVYFAQAGALGLVHAEGSSVVASGTSIPNGTVLASGIGAPWAPVTSTRTLAFILNNGTEYVAFPCTLSTAGDLTYVGAAVTLSATGSFDGSTTYRAS